MQILKPNSRLQASLQTPGRQAACSSSQNGSGQPLATSQAERMASKSIHPGARQPSDKQVTSSQLADTKLPISISTLTDNEVAR